MHFPEFAFVNGHMHKFVVTVIYFREKPSCQLGFVIFLSARKGSEPRSGLEQEITCCSALIT